MLEILKKGGPELVKQRFREILDVFRVRHLQHVQEAQDKELEGTSKSLLNDKTSVIQVSLPS